MAVQISGAIFLHVPKTGGTFIRNYFKETNLFIREIGYEHYNGQDIRDNIDSTEDLVFCFVRHPLTWYLSYWTMRQSTPGDRSGGYLDTIVDLPFKEFIETLLRDYPGYLTGFFNGYTSRCRAIGRQEYLRSDLNNILRMLRTPYNIKYLFERPVDNTTTPIERYPLSLALDVMKSEEQLIRRFNYFYIPERLIS